MSIRRAVPALALALLAALVLPHATASGFEPPEGAARLEVGGVEVAHWASAEAEDGPWEGVATELGPGAQGLLRFGIPNRGNASAAEDGSPNATTWLVAYVNLTSEGMTFEEPALVLTSDPRVSLVWVYDATNFTVAADAAGNVTYAFTVDLHEATGNGTTLLGSATGEGSLAVADAELPAPPGVPVTWLAAGGAAVLVAGGAGAIALKRRRDRARMNAAPRRSQVMREMAMERELERAREKEPERAQQIQQEIRQQEKVREVRRELQILEAKRADALKTLDLLRKRHEMGGLTKLQYDNMVAKKQADLQRIEAEIAQMEAEDADRGAAA